MSSAPEKDKALNALVGQVMKATPGRPTRRRSVSCCPSACPDTRTAHAASVPFPRNRSPPHEIRDFPPPTRRRRAGVSAAAMAVAQTQGAAPPAPAQSPVPLRPQHSPRTRGRDRSTSNGTVLMCQPQVSPGWANQSNSARRWRSCLRGGKRESFGVMFATARNQVDKVAPGRLREPQDHEERYLDAGRTAARHTPPSCRPRSSKVRSISLDRLTTRSRSTASPPTVAGRQQSAADPRQLPAGDPGADRRRAGAQARARRQPLPARHQHARADPARAGWATASTSMCTTAGCRPAPSPGRG